MTRTIIALGIVTLLGLLPGNLVVKESFAYEGFGNNVDAFCPSQPFLGDCSLCHLADRSADTPAKEQYEAGNLCYFCPDDAPCVGGGSCAGSAEASVPGVTREHGSSRLLSALTYFLLPVGAVIGLVFRRRKK